MAFNIKNDRTDELLRELTELTGESLTTAVTESLRLRLDHERRRRRHQPDIDPLDTAVAHFRAVGHRPAATEPVEYDEHGLPV